MTLTETQKKKLLQNKKVIEEINRHLWIESEKAGYDIGFEKAADDWIQRFAKPWIDYHMPKRDKNNFRYNIFLFKEPSKKSLIKNTHHSKV